MKKIFEKWKNNMWRVVTPLALLVTIVSVNSTCMFEFYQPQMPTGSEKLKNF